MQRTPLFSLVVLFLIPTLALQVPFRPSHYWHPKNQAVPGDEDRTEWNLERLPNPNDTDHFVFETVHSLFQHWPNTRMRNGHNIVPAVVPKGTLLYYGANATELPPGPEWVATDPEHSYVFCRDKVHFYRSQDGCWHLTLMTTRPLKLVYFDGSSGAKLPFGTMDTQHLLAWGEARPEDIWDEFRLIEDLCKWGKKIGVDGFVRMEMDFEIMLCDFTSGVGVVSWANLASFKPAPPFWPPFVPFEVVNSGSWHNHFPGETRIQPDLTGLISFYDTQLVPSLVAIRAGQERWDHRVQDISKEELSAVKSKLVAALIRPSGLSGGIDWKTLIQVIVDRFAGRLELTRHLLNSPVTDTDQLLTFSRKVQTQLRIMLTPYLVLSATPSDSSDKAALNWTAPIYKECAMPHTSFMKSELDTMTDSEKLLLRAVRGTSREICRVVTKMWATGVYAGIDLSLNTKGFPDVTEVAQVWSNWIEDLDQLMGWLDWSVWVKCDPSCGRQNNSQEMCYLPTWPVGFPYTPVPPTSLGSRTRFDMRSRVMESFAKEISSIIESGPDEWIRPEPKCIRRVDPYEF